MSKIKIIQISSCSSSFNTHEFKEDVFRSWCARVAFQLKKFYPKLEVECWTIERKNKEQKTHRVMDIEFKVFPTTLSIRPGMEISTPLITNLKREIKKAKKKNVKLIFHFHEYHSWLIYRILSSIEKNENIKIIAQHHGGRSPLANLQKYKKFLPFLPGILAMQFCENMFFKKVNTFYALSNQEIRYLREKAPNSLIKFQTMGIENEYFKKRDRLLSRKKLGLDLKKKYLLYLGRIKSTKGMGELLEGLKELKTPDVELLFIGQGVEEAKYKEYARKNNIKNIRMLGTKYGSEKLHYLTAVDCLILPSYTEGAPVVVMEAIANNTPVIATKVGGVSRMIKNNREGIIINPKSSKEITNAIDEILGWGEKNIRKYANKYKWEKIVRETVRDYQDG